MNELKNTVEQVAKKYANLVEKRIDGANELTGVDLHDIYEGIQMLGHIVATLERFSRMDRGINLNAEPYPRVAD